MPFSPPPFMFALYTVREYMYTLFYSSFPYCPSQIQCFLEIESLWQPYVKQVC